MPTAEASEPRRLLNLFQEPVLVVDLDGRIELANAGAKAFLGTGPEGRNLADFLADEPERLSPYLRNCSGAGRPVIGALVVRGAAGERRLQVQGGRYRDSKGGARPAVLLRFRADALSDFSILAQKVRDLNHEVRQRRRTQAALEEALLHKDTLLRELHHRVRNHTQMLLGMLALAERQSQGQELRAFVADLRGRLLAIGAAQQLMYQADQIEAIDAPQLLEALCDAIRASWPAHAALTCVAEPLSLRNDVGTTLALILNELTANALKHGLGYGPGEVQVTLTRRDRDILLTVWNSGDGRARSPSADSASGLALVRGLCRQIGGAFDISGEEGTLCTVRFPYRAVEQPPR